MTFIGPDPDVTALMGDKIASTQKAKEANVPVIPSHLEPVRDVESRPGKSLARSAIR
jgi:biotin carboxylase